MCSDFAEVVVLGEDGGRFGAAGKVNHHERTGGAAIAVEILQVARDFDSEFLGGYRHFC